MKLPAADSLLFLLLLGSLVFAAEPVPLYKQSSASIDWRFRRRRTLIPKGTRTAFRAEGEWFSERSDAGTSIVPEVFAFVKENRPERSGGRLPLAEKGVRGKDSPVGRQN
ncbi:MAG: hypothetical protein ABSH47_26635 [Bryobacteraceae bacterium]|jgi:hypothetical protein